MGQHRLTFDAPLPAERIDWVKGLLEGHGGASGRLDRSDEHT
jgi:hypothetical protein